MSANFKIDGQARCGAVGLIVADLDRSLDYYRRRIGLQLQHRTNDAAWLGVGRADLLVLTEQKGARPVQRGRTGLYHFAICVPSRAQLGRTLHHLMAEKTPIDGASDHGVSEALYLSDPDGHGIEIYRDRARNEWPIEQGALRMTLDPLDATGILAEAPAGAAGWQGLSAEALIGHVHLHVTNLPDAEQFYVDILGFDLMQRYGSQASFVAAGGYHHHVGLNTWAGVGAPPPDKDTARLNWFELCLPDERALQRVVDRVEDAGIACAPDGARYAVSDPSQNRVTLRVC